MVVGAGPILILRRVGGLHRVVDLALAGLHRAADGDALADAIAEIPARVAAPGGEHGEDGDGEEAAHRGRGGSLGIGRGVKRAPGLAPK